MLQIEKFKQEILDFAIKSNYSFEEVMRAFFLGYHNEGWSKLTKLQKTELILDWLTKEYQEPINLTKVEYDILKYLKKQGFNYIARQEDNRLFAYKNLPLKTKKEGIWTNTELNDFMAFGTVLKFLFPIVSWTDEKPFSIQDALSNCTIIEGD